MKIILITPTGGFAVEGSDLDGIASLLRLPPWVDSTYNAWLANDGVGDFTLHVGPGYTLTIPSTAPVPTTLADVFDTAPDTFKSDSDLKEIFHKAELYSDYHKDFYGYRPRDISGATPRDLAKRYDAIAEAHQAMLGTAEGRAKLRAAGWDAPEPAKKAAAKKVARRKA